MSINILLKNLLPYAKNPKSYLQLFLFIVSYVCKRFFIFKSDLFFFYLIEEVF